jgi:hypothetical protein
MTRFVTARRDFARGGAATFQRSNSMPSGATNSMGVPSS